jgi:hypothetical protein
MDTFLNVLGLFFMVSGMAAWLLGGIAAWLYLSSPKEV